MLSVDDLAAMAPGSQVRDVHGSVWTLGDGGQWISPPALSVRLGHRNLVNVCGPITMLDARPKP